MFRLVIYRNRLRRWSWSARGMNGERIAQGQSYSRRIDMLDALTLMFGLSHWQRGLLIAVGDAALTPLLVKVQADLTDDPEA